MDQDPQLLITEVSDLSQNRSALSAVPRAGSALQSVCRKFIDFFKDV